MKYLPFLALPLLAACAQNPASIAPVSDDYREVAQ